MLHIVLISSYEIVKNYFDKLLTDPLIQVRNLTKSLVKHHLLCMVGIYRWQKSELSVFKAKSENM